MLEVNIPASLPEWIREHIELYLRDGESAHYWTSRTSGFGPLTTLLLTTTGRSSGKQLPIPLIYRLTDDGGYCIIASKGGAPAHPAWYLNLRSQPRVQVKVANEVFEAEASLVEGEERERLWARMAEYFPAYHDYQAATSRQIPVVVLNPC